MKIDVLGTGCAKCRSLHANVLQALKELGMEAEVNKVEDVNKIVDYGVMSTPALAIDGDVKSAGKLLTVEQVKALLGGSKK